MQMIASLLRTLAGLFLALLLAPAVQAQSYQFTNSTDSATGGINDSATPCNNRFTRTFNVTPSAPVLDVKIGVLMAHTYRSDLLMYLVGPDGTRIQLTTGYGGTANNYNVLFDATAPSNISNYTSSVTVSSGTSVPPYAERYQPSEALSAFTGKNANGTWTLEICDRYRFDSGTFYQTDLFITTLPANNADLSLSKARIGNVPSDGGSVTWRLSVTSAISSTDTATGVIVTDDLPNGFTFTSASGDGSFSASNGEWDVGSLAPGQTKTIDIIGTITATAGVVITNTAEITASSQPDFDSTVDNGDTGEDDYASDSFTVAGTRAPGIAPALSCPAGVSLFDWDAISWTDNSTNNSYPVTDIGSVEFDIQTDGTWVFDNGFGGLSPTVDDANTGGFPGSQVSLHQYLDFANRNQTASTQIILPVAIAGAQFTLLDIDYAANDFADKVTVYGTNGGSTVYPTLTNGVTNYVIGNSAIGDQGTNGLNADGNVVVTFNQTIDTIWIVYGNHTTAPAVPDGQAIAIHDISFCKPVADLGVTKVSSIISDPVNGTTNPMSIPGAVVEYCLSVTNDTGTTVTQVVIGDEIPAQLTYSPGSITSGTTCANATNAEDDNTSGADDNDGIGASFSGTTLTANTPSLPSASSIAIKFRALIN